MRHGEGKFVYSDGAYYLGNWNFGQMDGYVKNIMNYIKKIRIKIYSYKFLLILINL